jgi:hypothetical protein
MIMDEEEDLTTTLKYFKIALRQILQILFVCNLNFSDRIYNTSHFLRNLQMGPISLCITLHQAEKACQ